MERTSRENSVGKRPVTILRANINDVLLPNDIASYDHFLICMRLYVDGNPPVGQVARSFKLIDEIVDWKKFS